MRLKRRQIVEEAVGVAEDLDAVLVDLGPGRVVAVVLLEDDVLAVEAVEEAQQPWLVRLLLLDELDKGADRSKAFNIPVFVAFEGVYGGADVSYDHVVGGRVGDHAAGFDVFGFGHVNEPGTDLVHELDADEGLLEGGHDVPLLKHGVVEVFFASHELAELFAGDVIASGGHDVVEKMKETDDCNEDAVAEVTVNY